MPGTNAGTGHPIVFWCVKCRKTWRKDHGKGHIGRLEATGRTRSVLTRAIRQTNRKIEYRCLDCGHVGWTQHIDAERLLRNM